MEKQINSLIRLSGVEIEKEQREVLQEELQTFLHYAQIIDKAPDDEDEESIACAENLMVEDIAVDWQGDLQANAPVLKESSYLVPPQQSRKHREQKLTQHKSATTNSWEVVIGLEVHAQLRTKSKLFCRCSTQFGKTPNANTCPVCTGQPGALPVLNKQAIRMAILAGLAMSCEINNHSVFARKNYFYPDSPKSYQISQFAKPLCSGGHLVIENENAQQQKVRLNRIHVEEDAGKMVHVGTPGIWGAQASAVDFNRTSIPLIEIVSEPDIQTPFQAKEYMTMLRTVLVAMNICDGNMEEGSLRCDANVSLRREGDRELGVKTEIKNLNSFKAVERALEYEIKRQKEILDSGNTIEQQTRLWDENKQKTLIMRTKEDSHDYRYFPDPDLRPVVVPAEWVENLRNELPQMPLERKQQFLQYGLSQKEAVYLMHNPLYAEYFESIRAIYPNAKTISNWFFSEILSYVNARASQIHIEPRDFADFLQAIDNEEISGKIGKQVVKEAFNSDKGLMQVIEEKQLRQISDEDAITKIVEEVLQKSEQQVAAYRAGKTTIFGYFVGQIMKASQGKANPGVVNKILRQKLGSVIN